MLNKQGKIFFTIIIILFLISSIVCTYGMYNNMIKLFSYSLLVCIACGFSSMIYVLNK